MHVWRVKNPVAHERYSNSNNNYGIGKPLKFYINNISFGLGTMKNLIFEKTARGPLGLLDPTI